MTITRFAPFPDRLIHVGNLRTALDELSDRPQNGGRVILRIDDTDPVRSKEEYVDGLKEDLDVAGPALGSRERQFERLEKITTPPGRAAQDRALL